MAINTMSMADVKKYLSEVDFPCDKQTLIDYAKDKDAPKELIDMLNELVDREYTSVDDVMSEMEM